MNKWGADVFDVILRTSVVYVFLVFGMRLSGKREMGQMTPFDLVLLLTISNAVQNAMVGSSVSLSAGLAAATTLLVLNFIMSIVTQRSKFARRVLEGTPTILVSKGEIIPEGLRKERVTVDDLEEVVREHGIEKVEDVDLAVMEVDGSISVIRYDAERGSRTRRGFRQLKQKP